MTEFALVHGDLGWERIKPHLTPPQKPMDMNYSVQCGRRKRKWRDSTSFFHLRPDLRAGFLYLVVQLVPGRRGGARAPWPLTEGIGGRLASPAEDITRAPGFRRLSPVSSSMSMVHESLLEHPSSICLGKPVKHVSRAISNFFFSSSMLLHTACVEKDWRKKTWTYGKGPRKKHNN